MQFQKVKDGYVHIHRNASKNRSGGIAQLNIANKTITLMCCPSAGKWWHCMLSTIDEFRKRIPANTDSSNNITSWGS